MRVLVVTTEWPSKERPDVVPFIVLQVEGSRRCGVDVDVFAFRGRGRPWRYAAAWRNVRRRLAGGAYDLVHAHYGQAGLACLGAPVPTVVTFHGSDLEGVVGPRGRYTLAGRLLSRLSRRVARSVDEVVVVSERLARRLPARRPPTVIPMPVDLETFAPYSRREARERTGLSLDEPVVLFSGRPDVPVKRFGLAQAAVAHCHSRPKLVTMSRLSRNEVADYMNAADVLLVTSLHEGGPMTVKEALACNLPVVSTDVGDVRRWIEGVPGCAIVEDDPEAIASALEQAFTAAETEARHAVIELDAETNARRLVEVYRRAGTDRQPRGVR